MAEQSSNEYQIYDSWDLARPSITPRTRLYPIQPIGLGTPRSESFTSYIARLAAAHSLTVYVLFYHELIPTARRYERANHTKFHIADIRSGELTALNGKGQTAQNLVWLIERLTGQESLCALTLLPWQAVLADKFLLRRVRAWCPNCFDELKRKRITIYERLSWAIAAVNICVDHARKLQTRCPHCQRTSPPMGARLIPGRCSRCLGWLGSTKSQTSGRRVESNEYESWVADQFGQLIAAGRGLTCYPTPRRFSNFLRTSASQVGKGNAAALAQFLGVSVGVYHDWQSMRTLPHINPLLKVCYRSSISLASLLTSDRIDRAAFSRLSRLVSSSDSRQQEQKIETALLGALHERPAPPVREIARRLGLKEAYSLYIKYGQLCRALTANYRYTRSSRVPRRRVRVRRDPSEIQAALQAALNERPLPPLREVARRLGYVCDIPLRTRFPELCRMLVSRSVRAKSALEDALLQPIPPTLTEVAKSLGYVHQSALRECYPELSGKILARRRQYRTQQLDQIRDSLQSMLLEDPPPMMNDVARRLGYKQFKDCKELLRKYFPELCEALKARVREHRGLMFQQLTGLLDAALDENPPPSLKEVVSRTGHSDSHISVTFPVQREVIKARYREFQMEVAAQRKAEAKSRIKRLAQQLHAAGIYPKATTVTRVLNGKVGMTTAGLTAVLREFRLQAGIRYSRSD